MDTQQVSSAVIAKYVLLSLLVLIAIAFAWVWIASLVKLRDQSKRPSAYQLLVGFITDFLDTLGVGSFATTTSLYRIGKSLGFGKSVEDDKLPGTLNVGHTLPTILQALIYIQVIDIDLRTLWLLILSSVVGAYFGARVVSRLPKRSIQLSMGFALLIAVGLILAKLLGHIPAGGESLGLTGNRLLLGMAGNFIFGALMTIGIGAYAPIMIMVSMLDMNQKAAFPLMMGSCAFLMPVASYRFVKSGKYDPSAALGLTLLGLPGVAIAAFIVKSLPLYYVNWMVVFVVLYAATMLLLSGAKSEEKAKS